MADAQVQDYVTSNPTYSRDIDRAFVEGKAYFCFSKLKVEAQAYSIYVVIGLAFLAALQFLALIISNYLLCFVKKDQGGYAEIDMNTGQVENPM